MCLRGPLIVSRGCASGFQDKHALTVAFETRQEAHREKLASQARLKRLTDHRSLAGFELAVDAPQCIAEQKKLDALTAEAKNTR